jgi:hypothetical protein
LVSLAARVERRRLRPICRSMAPEEFEAMIATLVAIQLKHTYGRKAEG